MNCKLCQENLEEYQEGRLPSGMKTQVESHLKTCDSCKRIFEMQIFADRVISAEKEIEADPFIQTRVMAQIERLETGGIEKAPLVARILRPALVTLSLAAAVFSGIILGNLSLPAGDTGKIPVELALIDDASLESVDILSLE